MSNWNSWSTVSEEVAAPRGVVTELSMSIGACQAEQTAWQCLCPIKTARFARLRAKISLPRSLVVGDVG